MTKDSQEITLTGSADLICEYLEVAMNAILFQRGVHPPKEFKQREFYGLDIFMLDSDQGSRDKKNLQSLKDGIAQGSVSAISLHIKSKHEREMLESWKFKIITRKGISHGCGGDKAHLTRKQRQVVKMEIGDVLRQIMASVSVLPRLHEATYSSIHIKYDGSLQLSSDWHKDKSVPIKNARKIRFRSFSTDFHRVKTSVQYKAPSSQEYFR